MGTNYYFITKNKYAEICAHRNALAHVSEIIYKLTLNEDEHIAMIAKSVDNFLLNQSFLIDLGSKIHIGKLTHGYKFIFSLQFYKGMDSLLEIKDCVVVNEYGKEESFELLQSIIAESLSESSQSEFPMTIDGFQYSRERFA